jgi:predicted RNase H-like nuclease (RuvC/YqgF family)
MNGPVSMPAPRQPHWRTPEALSARLDRLERELSDAKSEISILKKDLSQVRAYVLTGGPQ